jgi:hypothetical protein
MNEGFAIELFLKTLPGEIVGFVLFVAVLTFLLMILIKKNLPVKKNWFPLIAAFIGMVIGYFGYMIFNELDLDVRLVFGFIGGALSTFLHEHLKDREGKQE